MEILQNKLFLNKFSKYLLIGLSAMVLLAGSQQMFFSVLADEDDCATNPDLLGCPNPAEVIGEEPLPAEPAPQPPAPSCTDDFKYNECVACNTSRPVYVNSCSGAFSTGPNQEDSACGSWCPAPAPEPAPAPVAEQPTPPAPTPECDTSSSCAGICHDQNTGLTCGPGDGIIGSCTFTALSGGGNCTPVTAPPKSCSLAACPASAPVAPVVPVCNQTTSQESQCQGTNLCTFNVTRDCNNNVIARDQIACQPEAQCGSVAQVTCPVGTTLVNGACQPPTSCPTGQTLVNGICRPPVGTPGNQTTIITNNPTNTNTNTITNTVSGGTTTREVVREVPITSEVPIAIQAARLACPAGSERKVKDNVIVCEIITQPTVVAQVAGVKTEAKELPKTGLPALAWGALALIPLGARLKNLFKFRGDLQSHPVYFWEERQFKKDS